MSLTTPRTQDPICGMIVPLASEYRLERDGETFCFCSDHCRQKFSIAPASTASAVETSADNIG